MPRYQVVTKGDLRIPTIDHDVVDKTFKHGEIFIGKADLHDPLAAINPPIITRLTTGEIVAGSINTGSNILSFDLPYGFEVDALVATVADDARFALLTAGNAYTVWGIVSWFDSATAGSYRIFAVTGEGDDTAGAVEATFAFGAKTQAPNMTSGAAADINTPPGANNSVAASTGGITFGYTGTDPVSATLEIIYDPIISGNYGRLGRTKNPLTSYMMTRVYTPVTADDLSNKPALFANAGLEGFVKTKKEFNSGAEMGDLATLTYYYYTDATVTEPTHVIQQIDTVKAADFPPST